MDKLNLNAYENAYEGTFKKVANQQAVANAGGSAGSGTPDHLIKSPRPPSNISYLTSKPVRTIAYKWLICVQIDTIT